MKKSADKQRGSVTSESVLSKDSQSAQAHNVCLSDQELRAGMMRTGARPVFILTSPDQVRTRKFPDLFSLTTVQLPPMVDSTVGIQGLAEVMPA